MHDSNIEDHKYIFTNNWFQAVKNSWDFLIPKLAPKRILEIGCYEGACTCYLINKLASQYPIEIHCVDQWSGVINWEGASTPMPVVEERFLHNIKIAIESNGFPVDLRIHKGRSDEMLPALLADHKLEYFDLIYIDGSHLAADVLFDAVVSLKLTRIGGLIFFDDYNWYESTQRDILRMPKSAIDCFVNLNIRSLNIIPAAPSQFCVQKIGVSSDRILSWRYVAAKESDEAVGTARSAVDALSNIFRPLRRFQWPLRDGSNVQSQFSVRGRLLGELVSLKRFIFALPQARLNHD